MMCLVLFFADPPNCVSSPHPPYRPPSDAKQRAICIKTKSGTDRLPRVRLEPSRLLLPLLLLLLLWLRIWICTCSAPTCPQSPPTDPSHPSTAPTHHLTSTPTIDTTPCPHSQALFDDSELDLVRQPRKAGLAILGFKPSSAVGPEHTAATARFVYPDERRLKGSTAAFAALHTTMLKEVRVLCCVRVLRISLGG